MRENNENNKYRVLISTDGYQVTCNSKNAGVIETTRSMNAFMRLINGWRSTEYGLDQIKWRVLMFLGLHDEGHQMDGTYQKWQAQSKNCLAFDDDGYERRMAVAPLGPKCPDISAYDVMKKLKTDDCVRISFSDAYGYHVDDGMKDCYMQINRLYTYCENRRRPVTKSKAEWLEWYWKHGDKKNFAGPEEWFRECVRMGLLS